MLHLSYLSKKPPSQLESAPGNRILYHPLNARRERERDCVNFCTHCSRSALWFPCQRFKTFFGCQEMDLWWLVAQILPWYTCWRIWHTSHSELLAETPTCPSLAGKDWDQDLWSTSHPDNVINLECMKHLELPWSLTHRNGQSPCEQVCHHLT